MNHELQKVSFAGADLHCAESNGEVYVSLRRACDALGIDYSSQHRKLRDRHWATMVNLTTVAEDGAERELAMVDLDTLGMWLATIDAGRVNGEARFKVEFYQCECVRVLRRHFFPDTNDAARPVPRVRETRYPDGRVVVERFAEEPVVEVAAAADGPVVGFLPKPSVPLLVLRKRFHEALRSELGRNPRYQRLDADERAFRCRELNSRMKAIVGGLTRDEWKHRHYETAADWLFITEGLDIRWALAPVKDGTAHD